MRGEAGPVLVQDVAELFAFVFGEHALKRATMMEEKYGVGAYELLDQEGWRADFAGGVLDDWLINARAGVGSRECGG
jgi:hypothetical protein